MWNSLRDAGRRVVLIAMKTLAMSRRPLRTHVRRCEDATTGSAVVSTVRFRRTVLPPGRRGVRPGRHGEKRRKQGKTVALAEFTAADKNSRYALHCFLFPFTGLSLFPLRSRLPQSPISRSFSCLSVLHLLYHALYTQRGRAGRRMSVALVHWCCACDFCQLSGNHLQWP